MHKKKELLEKIAIEAGCTYISDLSLSCNRPVVKVAVESIAAEEFSVQEWKEAIEYIQGRHVVIETQQQGKELLRTGNF